MEPQELPDCYEILQVSRRADPLIITKAYRLLAAVYHPDNKETGNADRFCAIVDAYRQLVDPVSRAAYDRARYGADGAGAAPGTNGNGAAPSESELSTSGPAQDERELRRFVLQSLYNVRRNRPYKPGLPLLVIAELLGCAIEEAQFTVWYLRGKKLIENNEDDGLAITVAGVDYLEIHDVEAAPEVPTPPSLPHHVEEIPPRSASGAGLHPTPAEPA